MVNSAIFNISGFTAVAGGYRSSEGPFEDNEIDARFWTASSYNSDKAWSRDVDYWGTFFRFTMNKVGGYSIRLVKD